MSARVVLVGVLSAVMFVSGCESMGTAAQDKRVQGGVLGGVLGTAAGAIIGNQTGHAGEGAAVGAGLGALTGAVVGNAMQENQEEKTYQQQVPAPTATGRVKFSPVTGKEYPEYMKYDPETGVELRYKE